MATKHHTQSHSKSPQSKQHDKEHKTTTHDKASTSEKKRTDEKDEAVRRADEAAKKEAGHVRDRTAGQNGAIDQKRNDEQQYHAGGAAHDPHNRTQQRVDRGDADAGDVDEETRSNSAPYNKTYGGHE